MKHDFRFGDIVVCVRRGTTGNVIGMGGGEEEEEEEKKGEERRSDVEITACRQDRAAGEWGAVWPPPGEGQGPTVGC